MLVPLLFMTYSLPEYFCLISETLKTNPYL